MAGSTARSDLVDAINRAAKVDRGEFSLAGKAITECCSRTADYFFDEPNPDRTLWRDLFVKITTEGPWAGRSMNPIASKFIEVAGRRGWADELAFAKLHLERGSASPSEDLFDKLFTSSDHAKCQRCDHTWGWHRSGWGPFLGFGDGGRVVPCRQGNSQTGSRCGCTAVPAPVPFTKSVTTGLFQIAYIAVAFGLLIVLPVWFFSR